MLACRFATCEIVKLFGGIVITPETTKSFVFNLFFISKPSTPSPPDISLGTKIFLFII